MDQPDQRKDRMSEEQERPKPETLEVFYDLTKDALERQIDLARDLDAKSLQLFGAATVAAGLAGFSGANLESFGADWATATLLGMSFAAYAVGAYAVFRQVTPVRWKRIDYADFWLECWDLDANGLRHTVVDRVASNHPDNQEKLDGKARLVRWALLAFSAQIVLIGLAVTSGLTG